MGSPYAKKWTYIQTLHLSQKPFVVKLQNTRDTKKILKATTD